MKSNDYSKSIVLNYSEFMTDNDTEFAIDDVDEIKMLNNCIEFIREKDHAMRLFVVTYPRQDSEMVFSDNIIIITNLQKEDLEDAFSQYDIVAPYYIEPMTGDEKDAVVWSDVSREEVERSDCNIYSMYWE